MAVLNPHWPALTPETRLAFRIAAELPFIQRYYLAGGTGLALHLGHRFSSVKRFLEHQTLAAGRRRLEDLWSDSEG